MAKNRKNQEGRRKPASKSPKNAGGTPRKRGRRLLWSLKWTVTFAIWGVVIVAGVVAFYAYDLPSVDAALSQNQKPGITLVAADGARFASIGEFRGGTIRLSQMPAYLPQALVAVEDRRFYEHRGVDWRGIGRAMAVNLKAGGIRQGGSTLTQQAAKNLFLTSERTIKRKVQETLLALWLERRFTKEQILTIYLNRVYFGAGAYGLEAASRRFFDKHPGQLSLHEAAMLVGALKAPSRLNPVSDDKAARKRAAVVLAAMRKQGLITAAQHKRAQSVGSGPARAPSRKNAALYYADWVVDQLSGYVGPDAGSLVVETTLDTGLQRSAERAVANLIGGKGRARGISQAAVVVLSLDGAVRAMVGGRSYGRSQFNRAVQARRQPGSAFKPIVYLAGLEHGLRPSTVVVDGPVEVKGWKPRNMDGTYAGELTLRQALARSVNTVAAKVAVAAGIPEVISTAERLGITSRLTRTPSIALGTSEVGLLELTGAYAAIANGGIAVWPYGIERVAEPGGAILFERTGDGPPRVIRRVHARALSEMLGGVVSAGTGRAARLDRPAAGKTGTSQNFRDAWFVGYTADFVAGVWLGNDDGTPMRGVTGGRDAAKLWRAIMMAAHKDMPPRALLPAATAAPDRPGFFRRLFDRLSSAGG
ncbi:MAG: PBP1A family penicillin-binding protein [Rhodospirillales bacterium]|nr:PBP1A family penicillin-binding protein [Rhodospirillales bacterium]